MGEESWDSGYKSGRRYQRNLNKSRIDALVTELSETRKDLTDMEARALQAEAERDAMVTLWLTIFGDFTNEI